MQKLLRKIYLNSSPWKNYYTTRALDYEVKKDLKVGMKVAVTRKITENDITIFAKLTNDYNPIHVAGERPIAHGALLNGLLSGVLGTKLPGPGAIVIEQQLHYRKPCYPGDTVEIIVEVLSVRKIIKCAYRLIANSERIVLEGEGKFVMTEVDNDSLKLDD